MKNFRRGEEPNEPNKHDNTMNYLIPMLVVAAFIACTAFLMTKSQHRYTAKKLARPFAAAWIFLFGASPLIACANTYDAAVETRGDTGRFTATSALGSRHLLVSQTSATAVDTASATTPALGTVDNITTSASEGVTVLFLGKGDTKKVVASEAISVDAKVYQAAGGKVATTGTLFIGYALTASAADGDILELNDRKPVVNGSRSLTGATTLTSKESGATYFLNLAGGFTVTLPANAETWRFSFVVGTAPTTAYILLAATADTIIGYPVAAAGSDESANGNAAGDQINFVANTALPGDRVDVECNGTSIFARCNGKATGAITITG